MTMKDNIQVYNFFSLEVISSHDKLCDIFENLHNDYEKLIFRNAISNEKLIELSNQMNKILLENKIMLKFNNNLVNEYNNFASQ